MRARSRFCSRNISEDEFDCVVAVNFKGVFLGMKYVLKVIEDQGFGTIINTASTAGLKPEHSVAAYSETKHAVVSLTKSAALEYVGKGIRTTPSAQAASIRTLWQASRRHQDDRERSGNRLPSSPRMMQAGIFLEPVGEKIKTRYPEENIV